MRTERDGRTNRMNRRVLDAAIHVWGTADSDMKVIVVRERAARLLHDLGSAHAQRGRRPNSFSVCEQARAKGCRDEHVCDTRLGVTHQRCDERPVLRVVEGSPRPADRCAVAVKWHEMRGEELPARPVAREEPDVGVTPAFVGAVPVDVTPARARKMPDCDGGLREMPSQSACGAVDHRHERLETPAHVAPFVGRDDAQMRAGLEVRPSDEPPIGRRSDAPAESESRKAQRRRPRGDRAPRRAARRRARRQGERRDDGSEGEQRGAHGACATTQNHGPNQTGKFVAIVESSTRRIVTVTSCRCDGPKASIRDQDRTFGYPTLIVASYRLSSSSSAREHPTVLVGRAAEMRELERAHALAREQGQARTVTLVGPAGVGKTRLVRDFLNRAREGAGSDRVLRGTARDGGPTYEIFTRMLRARFGIAEGSEAEAAKSKMRAELAAVLDDRKVGDVAYFLGQLLDLDFQRSPIVDAIEGEAQNARMMRGAVIRSFLEADGAKGPGTLVLVFEDLQWAHDDSLDLLGALVDAPLRVAMLIVCIARAELLVRKESWQRRGGDRHVLVELSPLRDPDAAAVMHDLLSPCGDAPELDRLVDEAVGLAGGSPAILEQIVGAYRESGVLVASNGAGEERWTIHLEKLGAAAPPLSIEDAVQTRIASLSPQQRIALEQAAAMGGVFWFGGLLAIRRSRASPPEAWGGGEAADVQLLRTILTDLVERDYLLLIPDGTFAGDEEYVFKHNLERESIERLAPPASMREAHRCVADWLTFRDHLEASEEYLEMLGQHREKAGQMASAANAFLQAADVARSRYANAKAAELYAKCLSLFAQSEHCDEDRRLHALHHYGDVLQSRGRNDEALRAFTEMLARAWRLDLQAKGGAAHSRIGRLYRETGRLDLASQHLVAALALFEQSHDQRGVGSTLDDIGKLHWLRGDYPQALEYTLRGLAMRRKIGDRRSVALSLNNLGLVQQDSGNTRAALDVFEQALRIRREVGDLVGVSITLNNLGTVAQDMRDDAKSLVFFEEAYEVAKETGDRNRMALILTNLGETHNRLGDPAKAVAMLKQAESVADELGDKLGLAEAARGLGKAFLAQREYTKARECTQRAVDLFAETGSRVQLAVALRSLGEVTMAASAGGAGIKDAEAQLKRSIAIFEEIGNDVELARSARAYAELLRGTPEHAVDESVAAEAHGLLQRAEGIQTKMQEQAASQELGKNDQNEGESETELDWGPSTDG